MDIPIVIENGKIFIESRETLNPTEIGYAIIDAIQDGCKISIEKPEHDFDFIFKNKDIVYLVHDEEQLPRMILSNIIEDSCVKYELISGTTVSIHSGFELTKTKMVY